MQENQPAHKHLVRSATYMAAGTFSSRILGLLRDALLGAYFSRTVTDAWLVAFRIPNLFRRLFGEGALSASFIPVFIDLMTNPRSRENNEHIRLASGVFSLLSLILVTMTLIGVLFAEEIVHIIAGEVAYLSVPGKFELTVQMMRIMFIFCLFICLYAYFMAILNAYKKFSLAAFAPVLFNVAMIVSTLLPVHWSQDFSNTSLAWGVVVGGFLQMAVLIPGMVKLNCFPKLGTHFWDKNISKVFQKMLPGLLGLSVMQIGLIINTRFAASLEEGANSWIYWADRVLELPLSLFAVSLGTALLPTLSTQWSKNEKKEMVSTANQYLRMIFFISVPCFLGVWCLSRPIVEVLFFRGKFSEHDLINTSQVLMIYSVGILSFGGIRVIAPSFYAIKNTMYPAVVSALCLIAHYFIAQFLMAQYGIEGLASSSMVSSFLNFILLLVGFKWMVGELEFLKLLKSLFKYFLAGLVMAAVTMSYGPLVEFFGGFYLFKVFVLLFVITLSVIVYFSIMAMMKSEEFDLVFSNLKRKVLKKI